MTNKFLNGASHPIFSALMYLLAFMVLQFFCMYAVLYGWAWVNDADFKVLMAQQTSGIGNMQIEPFIISSATSSLLTIALFGLLKWTDTPRSYLRTRPWAVLFWVVLLTLGTILPSIWLQEVLQLSMPERLEQHFMRLLENRWGYLVLGILAPVVEEVVFRGAILRVLLHFFRRQRHWAAIVVSALFFGLIHMNSAQFLHAFLMGILLGWLYCRSDSIVPGIVLHWVNNTVAYASYKIAPQLVDLKLIDIFGGSQRSVTLSLVFSMMIFVPALLQLHMRMKR